MDRNVILNKLETKLLGRNLLIYDSIGSTQDEVKRPEIKNGTVVIAETQTNGQGTHGRVWYTDTYGRNIAFSICLYPEFNIEKLENITIKIAECIVETFKNLYNIKLDIKYPNDIVYNGRKIGGILTQTRILKNKVRAIYIGIGLNINQSKFNEEICSIATSIKNEFDVECKREDIIVNLLNLIEKEYLKLQESRNE